MIQLPLAVLTALQLLNQQSFEAFVVGGCVRDFLLKKQPYDWDITTNAKPNDCIAIFKQYKTTTIGVKFGTITVYIDNLPIEITTYRTNEVYINGRKPHEITFANTLEEDLSRRDFTINAFAYHPDTGIIDCFNGKLDLSKRSIRAIGDAKKRFQEDHLRILRAIRFACTLGFTIEPQTFFQIKQQAHTITMLSPERIASELSKILLADKPNIALLNETVLPFLIPELRITPLILSKLTLAFTHSPAVLTIRLAIILHTLPKDIALDRLKYLRYPTQIIRAVMFLIQNQCVTITTNAYTVRKTYHNFGEHIFDWLLFQNALTPNDTLLLQIQEQITLIKQKKIPIFNKDLAINGNDLKSKGIVPTQIGALLNICMQRVLKDSSQNTKQDLFNFLEKNHYFLNEIS